MHLFNFIHIYWKTMKINWIHDGLMWYSQLIARGLFAIIYNQISSQHSTHSVTIEICLCFIHKWNLSTDISLQQIILNWVLSQRLRAISIFHAVMLKKYIIVKQFSLIMLIIKYLYKEYKWQHMSCSVNW